MKLGRKKEINSIVIDQGMYRHFKENYYEVLDVFRSLESLVIYHALYGDFGLLVRSLTMFVEDVTANGVVVK